MKNHLNFLPWSWSGKEKGRQTSKSLWPTTLCLVHPILYHKHSSFHTG